MRKIIGLILVLFLIILGAEFLGDKTALLEDSVLRLHVIANSDSIEDQSLKIKVKDEIVKLMRDRLKNASSAGEAVRLAEKSQEDIRKAAEEVIIKEGFSYPVEVYVDEFDFPVKSYGNLVFPAGRYEAVRVVIGEGEGKNWWCVLFPPLCLVSSSDKGLSFDSPEEARVSLKCLELLPKGVKFSQKDK
ncbi:stage II sporulation protein R [Thermosyntropha sp.]|uniref:stage II sporulation protein R n=1 Tax=Thermosyntropha sp. TaxID=2740820 RepID=UPI0025D4F800|nr:stage II sporulation protein R [Thermosyntropha sp.]MBO8159787.1 stage II sporulation protein R [Thermosyntropha sp.]